VIASTPELQSSLIVRCIYAKCIGGRRLARYLMWEPSIVWC
jgi:hypothetical protein